MPYQELACAVIKQTTQDLRKHKWSTEAHKFFFSSTHRGICDFWLTAAGLDSEYFRERLRVLVEKNKRIGRTKE